MKLVIKHYDELTLDELHDILKLRVAVFVVEQSCPYQEVDGHDPQAYHLWIEDDETGILSYLRVLPPATTHADASIGRVVSLVRRQGLATRLLREGIRVAREKFGAEHITLDSQVYVRSLYEKVGFMQVSEEFLEDGIPHVRMRL